MDVLRASSKRIIERMNTRRIGIYAGTFDPVHSGHISFALQALHEANLGEVYFLPERKPRFKPGAEHYGHRVAMLRRAVQPHTQLSIAEVVDKQFTVKRTFLHLKQTFSDGSLVFLMGADVFVRLHEWQEADQFVQNSEFIVAVRSKDELKAVLATIQYLHIPSKSITILDSLRPDVTSTQMRYAIRQNKYMEGLLVSVAKYARREWLYVSVRQNI